MEFIEVVTDGARARFTPNGEGGELVVEVDGVEQKITVSKGGYAEAVDNARYQTSYPLSTQLLGGSFYILNELDYAMDAVKRSHLDTFLEYAPGRGVTCTLR